MAQKYPTYLQFDICQNFRSFFFWDPSLTNSYVQDETAEVIKRIWVKPTGFIVLLLTYVRNWQTVAPLSSSVGDKNLIQSPRPFQAEHFKP